MKIGFKKLDKTIKLRKGELILLDKKEDIINIITNITLQNIDIFIFAMETSKEELIERILASKSSVDIEKIRLKKDLTDDEWNKLSNTIKEILNFKLYIDDTQKSSIQDILTKCKKLKEENNIELALIEWPQLIYEDVEIIEKLKEQAKDLNITIIMTSKFTEKIEE